MNADFGLVILQSIITNRMSHVAVPRQPRPLRALPRALLRLPLIIGFSMAVYFLLTIYNQKIMGEQADPVFFGLWAFTG
jgi:hypothetical protein